MALFGPMASRGALFPQFEARHTHSIDVTPDGKRLLAVNSAEGMLSVFSLEASEIPLLIREIPVGLAPVAVRARTTDEIWVVSEVSDTVSIISLAEERVTDQLTVRDEPAAVAFAGGKAFVVAARTNELHVFDAETRAVLSVIPLNGLYPRAITASEDHIYVSFFHSGNGTTTLDKSDKDAPAPDTPDNPDLPAAPQVALIVPAEDQRIDYHVLDHDVAKINVDSLEVEQIFEGVGTNLTASALSNGTLWVTNTEALNLVAKEPELRGNFIRNRVTAISLNTGTVTPYDLNAGIDYTLLPNNGAREIAVAQPTAVVSDEERQSLWIAGFGSDRIVEIDRAGNVIQRIDLRENDATRNMRGPRALALSGDHLYVLNKLSDTIMTINRSTHEVLGEVPLSSHDPMPEDVRKGRKFLYDARLSGNGMVSCASCHPDAGRDGIAWDLGDPAGEMVYVTGVNASAHSFFPMIRNLHPMKGPMTTQTLVGLREEQKFHWRGDRANLDEFNNTFDALMGGDVISDADFDDLKTYLFSLKHHPNPNRNLDDTLPEATASADAEQGKALFLVHENHCAICHPLELGTDDNLDIHEEVGATQPLKNPGLATVYQRVFFNPKVGQDSLSGYGLGHDGTLFSPSTAHPYSLLQITKPKEFNDVAAFVLAFSTGTVPTVGHHELVTAANAASPSVRERIETLETEAVRGVCGVVVRGVLQGLAQSFVFDPDTGLYVDGEDEMTKETLLSSLDSGDSLGFLGVLPRTEWQMGIDRDGDGNPNEILPPVLTMDDNGVFWQADTDEWVLEVSNQLDQWSVCHPDVVSGNVRRFYHDLTNLRRFYRLRCVW